jgi:hypothetical protein
MGNPHAVQVVIDVDSAPVAQEGPHIESHPAFPKRVNAGYMQVLNRNAIKLRVYERGAGETLGMRYRRLCCSSLGDSQGLARFPSARANARRRANLLHGPEFATALRNRSS